jgi:hypothetical protein
MGAPDGSGAIQHTAFGKRSHFSIPGERESLLITPGQPSKSAIAFRMGSRNPVLQMPPLGTHLVDEAGRQLIERWISEN